MNKAVFEGKVFDSILLIDFLRNNINGSKNNVKSLIINNCVYVNGNVVSRANYVLNALDFVFVILRQIRDKNYLIDIIYEDDYFIGINKPAGLLSISNSSSDYTAYSLVRKYINNKNGKLFILHRLDRDTSGILFFCKDFKLREKMQNNWDYYVTKRGYLAVVNGIMKESGVIRSYLYEDGNFNVKSSNDPKKGKLAITNYSVLACNKKYSLVQVFLDTGRKNQIRVHMNSIGHSILGDKKYGSVKADRLYLHANVFSFIHPVTSLEVVVNCYIDFDKYFKKNK